MFSPSRLKGVLTSILLILVGMLVVLISTGVAGQWFGLGGPPEAKAANDAQTLARSNFSFEERPEDTFECTSVGVAVYPERIHVECSPATPAGIRFFALGTSHSSHTARILSILSMAHVTGKPIYILYDQGDTSGTAIGCADTDCRLIISAAILP
jgi:hypothetical protein